MLRFFPPVFCSQPPRRLGAKQHAEPEEQCRERLDRERKDVLDLALHVEVGRVVDPEGDHATRDDEQLVHAGEQTADGSWGVFGHVDWVDGTGCADTDARDETTGVDAAQVAGRGALHNDTGRDHQGYTNQAPFATEAIRQGPRKETTEEATGLKGRHDVGGQIRFGHVIADKAVIPDVLLVPIHH